MKNYIGQSRPLGEYNKNTLLILESNLNYHNRNKRKGILTVEHYITGGDWWRLMKDDNVILDFQTLSEINSAVTGIINYNRKEE